MSRSRPERDQPAPDLTPDLTPNLTLGLTSDVTPDVTLGPAMTGLCGVLGVCWAPGLLRDPDTWWHVATGRWIWAHGRVPVSDPFSWTMAGQPWNAHEWLAEWLMALAFRLDGWAGIVALTALACGLALAVLTAALRRIRPDSGTATRVLRPGPAGLLVLLAVAGVAPDLLARPHILALPCLTLWAAGLVRDRDADRIPSPWLLPVMLIWANLHGGFMVGLVFAAGLAAEAVLARSRQSLGWLAFLLAAVAVAGLTPQGWHGLVFPLRLLRMHSLASITEWRPISITMLQPVELMAACLLGLIVLRGVRVPPVRALMLLGLAWTACAHSRNQMLAGVLGVLLLAGPVARGRGLSEPAVPPPRPGAMRLAGVLLLVGATLGLRLGWPIQRGNAENAPVAALAAVPPALRMQPVLNDADFGGYLIFRGVRPFIDGRADLYGDAFVDRYAALLHPGPALPRFLAHGPVTWTLFKPGAPVVAMMDRMPGWRRLYTGSFAVIHTRISR